MTTFITKQKERRFSKLVDHSNDILPFLYRAVPFENRHRHLLKFEHPTKKESEQEKKGMDWAAVEMLDTSTTRTQMIPGQRQY